MVIMGFARSNIAEIKKLLYKNYKEKGTNNYSITDLHELVAKLTGFESKTIATYLRKLNIMGCIKQLPHYTGFYITDELIKEEKEIEKKEIEENKNKIWREQTTIDGLPKY